VIVPALLAELRTRDIQVWADGDQLRCSAPTGVLTPELKDALRVRKRDIVEFLRAAEALAGQQRAIVPLQPRGEHVPVFAVPGHNGDVFCYRALAEHLGEDQPLFGLEPPGLDGRTVPLTRIEDLAAYFAAEIRAFRPEGPYVIAGYCAGGTIAFELARQLLEQGADVRSVALFAGPWPSWYRFWPQVRHRLTSRVASLIEHARVLAARAPGEWPSYVDQVRRRRRAEREARRAAAGDPELERRARLMRVTLGAVRRYVPRYLDARLSLFLPSRQWQRRSADALLARRWRPLARDVEEYWGPDGGRGDRVLLEPEVRDLAALFRRARFASSESGFAAS
jgi:thioesterase domain-containing protein